MSQSAKRDKWRDLIRMMLLAQKKRAMLNRREFILIIKYKRQFQYK